MKRPLLRMFSLRKRFRRRKLFGRKYRVPERRKTRMMIFILLWGIIFAWFVKTFIISLEVVQGASMYPAFQRGDFRFVNKFIYVFAEPQRGDVIIIKNIWLREDQLIKRVIGVPGDIIETKGGGVYLNEQLLDEPYAKGGTFPDKGPFITGKNMYFVMGDNREISYDSRHFGFIRGSEIRGRVAP